MLFSMKEIVFATNNAHKLRELREITASKGITILSLAEIGCYDDIPETADTIEGNAIIKAEFVKHKYGYDCFADDTGLEIEALGGEPGVYSARYAGEDCNSERNIDKVLYKLQNCNNRKARFRTAIALCTDKETVIFEGKVEGEILHERHGNGGFGYDSIFKPCEAQCSFAEMKPEEKNSISHRGRAVQKFLPHLFTL